MTIESAAADPEPAPAPTRRPALRMFAAGLVAASTAAKASRARKQTTLAAPSSLYPEAVEPAQESTVPPLLRYSPFQFGLRAALGVAVAYWLCSAVIAVQQVVLNVLVAAFLAIALNPTVERLMRKGLSRAKAVAVVLLTTLILLGGVGAALVPPVVTQGNELVKSAPAYLDNLRGNPQIERLDDRFNVIARVQEELKNDTTIGPRLAHGVIGAGKAAAGSLFSALTVLILAMYFLASLPALKQAMLRLVPGRRRRAVHELSDKMLIQVGGYVGGMAIIASISGATSLIVLFAFGVPYPFALALVVTLCALIPLIGATIAALIVSLVACTVSLKVGVIVAIYFLAYQQFENYFLAPKVMRRSVNLHPAATLVAVLVGGALLGVLGALLAIPVAAALQLLLNEVVYPRQDNR